MSLSESQPTITGIGGTFGEESVSNSELIERLGIESSPEWIAAHTGIEHRYWAKDGTLAADLGTEAARQALLSADHSGEDLAGIYLTTLTPDYLGPYTATEVHRRLEAGRSCFALELTTACSGAVVALSMAADEVTLRKSHKVMAISTEIMSRILDPTDRRSAILFGDGAGAMLVEGVAGSEAPVFTHATAPDRAAIYAPAGGLAEPGGDANDLRRKIQMKGVHVARHALTLMPEVLTTVLKQDGALNEQTGQIDWDRYSLFVPHQANGVLIRKLWDALGVPEEKQLLTVDQHGNTSSASIPLALQKAHEDGRLEGHSRILMAAIGAGMVAAAGAMDVRIGQHSN